MPCYSPLTGWQTVGGEVVFAERGNLLRELTLPCGQCIGCRLERSRRWAVRIMHEAQCWPSNCFLTLTYRDEAVPSHGSLVYRHFQLFMKRLRKARGSRIRFFMCGEYGETTQRPHYHACLFGCDFSDAVDYSVRDGIRLRTSRELERLWGHGFCTVGDLTFESAAYVGRYCVKKVTGRAAEDHYTRLVPETGELVSIEPEFARMSLRPGIGATWLEKFMSDVYNHDYVIVNGRKHRPPKYYDKHLAFVDPDRLEQLQHERTLNSQQFAGEHSRERLAVRENVAKARMSLKSRSL